MSVGYSDSVLLGVIQGLTEFLPVSSSGHLAIGQMWLGLVEGNLTLSVILHAGTLVATVVYFYPRLRLMMGDLVANSGAPRLLFASPGGQDARTVLLASLPTAVVGLALKDQVEAWTTDSAAVGYGFLLTGAVLVSTRFAQARLSSRPASTTTSALPSSDYPSVGVALLVGLAQAIAIAPGISRSGSTIAAFLWLGVRPGRAFELSMLISLPAVFGAFLLEARHVTSLSGSIAPMCVGALVALCVGLLALRMLKGVVTGGRFAWFALWVVPMGVAALFGG